MNRAIDRIVFDVGIVRLALVCEIENIAFVICLDESAFCALYFNHYRERPVPRHGEQNFYVWIIPTIAAAL